MFEKILVPLDGSEFSECALEPAFGLAQKFGSEVILLRVAVPEELLVGLPSLVPRYYGSHGAENQRDQEEAEAYLYGIRMRWLGAGVPVRTEVISGTPPESIVELAKAAGAALIVMCTHGRSGFSRLIYGSVAEAVLRGASLPVMLIPTKVYGRTPPLLRGRSGKSARMSASAAGGASHSGARHLRVIKGLRHDGRIGLQTVYDNRQAGAWPGVGS